VANEIELEERQKNEEKQHNVGNGVFKAEEGKAAEAALKSLRMYIHIYIYIYRRTDSSR